MRALLTAALVLACTIAQADKLIIGGVSEHIGSPVPLNETHPGLGIERNGYELAVYHNSLDRVSFVVAKLRQPWRLGPVKAGYRIGLATGYEDATREGYDGRPYSMDGVVGGLMPQVQAVFSYSLGGVTMDAGLSAVSTLTFKVDI